jgi:hypothetical protein
MDHRRGQPFGRIVVPDLRRTRPVIQLRKVAQWISSRQAPVSSPRDSMNSLNFARSLFN